MSETAAQLGQLELGMGYFAQILMMMVILQGG